MVCQAAEITDDEASLGTPEIIHKEPNKGTRPVTPDVDIEKKNDSFKLLKDKKKIPRSLRIKCTLSTSPEFMTNNEFITLKEELDDGEGRIHRQRH